MKDSGRAWTLISTHGAAVLLGFFVMKGWLIGGSVAKSHDQQPAPPVHGSREERTSAWIDDTLRKVREREAAESNAKQPTLTLPETLEKLQLEVATNDTKLQERIERVANAARNHHAGLDPAEAIRAALRAARTQDEVALVILQAWLERDPVAALAELGRNRGLLRDRAIPEMLEREFGSEWMIAQIGDDLAPYPLRTVLASWLGLKLARGERLDELLRQYHAIADPKLKSELAAGFAGNWPMGDTAVIARFLADQAPVDLRRQLLAEFGRGVNPFGRDSNPEWFKKLRAAMDPADPPEDDQKPALSSGSNALPETASFAEVVEADIKDGQDRDDAVKAAMFSKTGQVLTEGTDLVELYGEGRISRRELLVEFARRVPGADKYPELLERAAWRWTVINSDAHQAMRWANELSQRGDIKDLVQDALYDNSSVISQDPRMIQRLARLQIIGNSVADGPLRTAIVNAGMSRLRDWSEISPAAAEAWVDALPPDDALRKAFRQQTPNRKESP